jgi:hypothetical protein
LENPQDQVGHVVDVNQLDFVVLIFLAERQKCGDAG